jgi:hypothetical protein
MPFAFEKLEVYQKAVTFADACCSLTKGFPRGYFFPADQLNRAARACSLWRAVRRPVADPRSAIEAGGDPGVARAHGQYVSYRCLQRAPPGEAAPGARP